MMEFRKVAFLFLAVSLAIAVLYTPAWAQMVPSITQTKSMICFVRGQPHS